MKTISTLKNGFIPHLFFLTALVLLIPAPSFAQVKHSVNVTNYKFTPSELQIQVGDTVEWKNTQGFHNVNGTKTAFPSNPESFGNSLGSGWTYKFVFKTAGKYDYHCDPHIGAGMVGKIEVKETGGNDDGKYILTINFTGMTPHVGQNLQLAVIEKSSGIEIQRVSATAAADFLLSVYGIATGKSYNVDFFADHNKNGVYNAPPADHAWRIELNNVMGDTTLNFQHNTSFTDIKWITTSISELSRSSFNMYPNPATNKVTIETSGLPAFDLNVSIYDISGKLMSVTSKSFNDKTEVDIQRLTNGIYFIELGTNDKKTVFKLIKQ